MKKIVYLGMLSVICAAIVGLYACKSKGFKPFGVYVEQDSPKNHFTPSGLMGDFGDISIDGGSTENPHNGKTCIKVMYSGKVTQKAGWAGAFWQHPKNNWGNTKEDGFNLTGATKLTFWARGEKGNELISEFKVGGIAGEYGDSGSAFLGMVTLTKDWKQYTIDLADVDLSYIIGGFCWSAAKNDNPDGFTIYLDDIMFE